MTNNWNKTIDPVLPYVYKIKTPNGSGTGFQIFYSQKLNLTVIATALHVINHENEWEEPIKLIHHQSNTNILLKNTDRKIEIYPEKDLALIYFSKKDSKIPTTNPKVVSENTCYKVGVEIGWCGYPSISNDQLCFFEGFISCILNKERSYLVDGIAINGVSGGPAFIKLANNTPVFIGIISAYIPNRSTGETLPGLSVVRSVEPYQESLKKLKSFELQKEKDVIKKK